MWINVPYTTSPFAQAEQVSTSDWNWLWEAFARSVGWSGKPSPSSTWQRRWKRAAWFKRLCGRICEPSMADRGVESWIASLRATRASRSAPPANVVEKTILDTFGPTSVESLAKWNRQSCFSKTCPAILASASRKSPAIFKQWVTKLRRDSLLRRKSALATSGNGCSSSRWQTIKASDGEKGGPNQRDGKGNPYLPMQAALWGTPADYSKGGGRSRSGKRIGELLLPGQAKMWATPRAEERSQHNSRDDYVALSRQAPLWPTPNVPNGGRTVPEQQMQAGKSSSGRKVQKPLARTAEIWRSPNARDYHPPGKHQNGQPDQLTLPEQARNESACHCSRLDPKKSKHGRESLKSTRRLSPRFVGWLMGWPPTDSGSWEMGSCPSKPPMPSFPSGQLCEPPNEGWREWRSRMKTALMRLVHQVSSNPPEGTP